MSDTKIYLNPNEKLYLRISRDAENTDTVVKLVLPKELAGKYVRIEVLRDDSEDMPVRARCKEKQCKRCGVMYCSIRFGNAELKDIGEEEKKKELEDKATIPGHPNCHYGDCYDCHVVSCAIQQGWEDIPVEPISTNEEKQLD